MSAHQYWQTLGMAECSCDDDYIDRINRLIDEALEKDNERTYQTDASAAEAAKRQTE